MYHTPQIYIEFLLVVVLQGLYAKDLALKSNMALVKELQELDAPQATEPPSSAKRLRGPVDPAAAIAGQWFPMQGMQPMPMQWWPQQPWYPPPHYGGSSSSGSGHTWQPHR